MILAHSQPEPYRTAITNGTFQLQADTRKHGRGGAGGLRPHELLEAALAACTNISVRLEAERLQLGPVSVRSVVQLDRSRPGEALYRFRVRLDGALGDRERRLLEAAARECAVGATLRRTCTLLEDSGLEVAP